jgi:hypothetical protein
MSDLVYQNYNNRCQGWINPSNLSFGPEIISLSSIQSPAGSSTVVSIYGTNFFSYSIIRFGTFTPTAYFVNSTILQFYVPNTLNSGTFPVQVCNGSVCSNIVNYTIDNASGYWLLNSNGNITNTNNNGVGVSWLSRGAPFILDNTTGNYSTLTTAYSITNYQSWIICNGDNGLGGIDTYIELPSGIIYDGREIMFKSIGGLIISTTINISDLSGISTDIIVNNGAGNWSTLVYTYSSNTWIIMQSNWG